jgi:hypothetical protein
VSRGLKVDSCAVRVSQVTKAALVAGASDLMRATGQVAHVGGLVDELVAGHLKPLLAAKLAAIAAAAPESEAARAEHAGESQAGAQAGETQAESPTNAGHRGGSVG